MLVMIVLGLAGCATLSDVVQEKDQGGGTVQVIPSIPTRHGRLP
jgi:hypothetical protein